MNHKRISMFEVALLTGLFLAAIGAAVNLRLYFTYGDAVVKTEPLARLDEASVERALDGMNLTNAQRDLLQRTISGDQKDIASLHEVLVSTLRVLQHQYGHSAIAWTILALFFPSLFLLDRRRQSS